MRQIFTSYDIVDTEAASNGTTREHGWYVDGFTFGALDKPKHGFSCEPDELDIEEGDTAYHPHTHTHTHTCLK